MRMLLLSFGLLLVVTQILGADTTSSSTSPARRLSRFRLRTRPNAFDLSQPIDGAIVPDSSVDPPRLTRRRGTTGDPPTGRSRSRTRRPVGGGSRRRLQPRISIPRTATNSLDNDLSPDDNTQYKIVCYYTNWSQYRPKIGKYMPEDIDPTLCTHIIYAFGWMNKGKLSSYEANDESKDGKVGFYEQVTGLKHSNPNLKVLLALGGWSFGTKKFKEMSSSRYTRQIFITSAVPFLRKHNYDGLDVDWEYPKGSKDKANFVLLLKELKDAFVAESEATGKTRLLLTAAVPVGPDNVKSGYDVPIVSKYLDFLNVMSYDFHGKWENTVGHNAPMHAPGTDSTYRKQLSVHNAAKMWVRLGTPKKKIILGMPTYGRSFTLRDPRRNIVNSPSTDGGEAGKYTGESGFMAYYEVCEQLQTGGRYVWNEEMQVPYMVKNDLWVGFDDERSIRNKMNFIIDNGYGGAMVWTLDMDDFRGDVCGGNLKYPLISIMSEMLLNRPRRGSDVDWAKVTNTSIAPLTQVVAPLKSDVKIDGASARVHLSVEVTVAVGDPKVVCYYTSWSVKRPGAGRFDPENLDPFLCTHIIYAFGSMKDFMLSHAEDSDIGDSIKTGMYKRMTALKETNPDLKVLLALGGWAFGSKPFQELVSNEFRMNTFVYGSIDFLRKHSFDGLDIDWEYPRGPDDKANYVNLIKELRLAYEGEAKSTGHPRLLVTAAVPASFEALAVGYDVPELAKYLDYFNVMTYDFHGQWEDVVGHNSPLLPLVGSSSYNSKLTVEFSLQEWIKQGAPAQKVLMGVPAYGRSFKLADVTQFDIGAPTLGGGTQGRYTQEAGFLSYYEVCDFLLEENTTLVWDNEQQVPFAYRGNEWVGFDDRRSMGVKMDWVKSSGLGGVMVWSVDMDDFRGNCGDGGKYPLLRAMNEGLSNYSVPLTFDGPYENSGTLSGVFNKKDPNEVSCEGLDGLIEYFKDVADCTKYYMCEGERKHHMPCPVNLVYNHDETVCDWPENVPGCENAITSGKRRK